MLLIVLVKRQLPVLIVLAGILFVMGALALASNK